MPFKDAPGNTRKKQLKKKARKPAGQYTPGSKTPVTYPKAPKPKPKPRPRRPVVQAPSGDVKSSGGDYGTSQAKQYKKKEIRKRKRRLRTDVKDVKSDRDLGVAKTFKQFDRYKKDTAFAQFKGYQYDKDHDRRDAARKRLKRTAATESAANVASSPVLKVLDQTTRPLHALAGAARKDVEQFKKHGPKGLVGHGSLKEAGKGIRNETKFTTSDVLTEAGWKPKSGLGKFAKGAVSLTGDIAGDPVTYATGGTSSIARKAGQSAAKNARKKALAKGLTTEQADRFATRAAKQAEKKAPQDRGVTVKFAGKEVPGVARGTAKAARPVKKAARKVVPEGVRRSGRNVTADVNPNSRPAGVSRTVNEGAIQATRTARAKRAKGERDAGEVAEGIRRQVGEENYRRVVDAIEAGTIRKLPDELAKHAHTVESQSKGVRRLQRRAGVKVADVTKSKAKDGDAPVKGYVYRQLTDEAVEADAKAAARHGGINPASSKTRKEKRRLADIRKDSPGRYREDLHALSAERLAQGTSSAAKAELNRTLGGLGRDVKRGKPIDLKDGEAVFHIKGAEIVEVTDRKLLDRIVKPLAPNKKGTKLKGANKRGGRYVVLNREVVERAKEGSNPQLLGPGILHGFDKATSGFKRIALATPGYHLRNLVGDSFQAYVGQPGRKLPGNMARSGKVLKELGRQQKSRRNLEPRPAPSGKTLKTGLYGDVSLEEIADRLVKHGAARSGFTAKELKELSESGGKSGGKVARAGRALRQEISETTPGVEGTKRALLNREDLPRVASAIYALQRGATWEQAAKKVADTHFDYGHLTSFERNVARRILPFYTWSARNIPFTTKNVVAKPGKYANYQKIRENAAKMSGVDEQNAETRKLYADLEKAGVKLPKGWEKYLTEWEQRNAGVPIKTKDGNFTISMGLPIGDLNEFPGAAGKDQAREYYQKFMSMVNPIVKDPVEFFENHSFFFRDEIQREYSPNVAAPSYVGEFPPGLRKELGIVKIQDKKTGKMQWGWPAKLDYIAKAVPGTPQYAQQLATPGADRRGKGTLGKALGYVGVKAVPVDPARTAVGLAFATLEEIAEKKGSLNQQGVGATKGRRITPAYRKLLDREKILRGIAYQGRVQEGYKVLPTQGAPKKRVRVKKFDGGSGVPKWDGGGGSGVPKWDG
jgi:hypothetical protein